MQEKVENIHEKQNVDNEVIENEMPIFSLNSIHQLEAHAIHLNAYENNLIDKISVSVTLLHALINENDEFRTMFKNQKKILNENDEFKVMLEEQRKLIDEQGLFIKNYTIESNSRFNELKNRNQETENRLTAHINLLENNISILTADNEVFQSRISSLENRNNQLTQINTKLEAEKAVLVENNTKLSKEIKELQIENMGIVIGRKNENIERQLLKSEIEVLKKGYIHPLYAKFGSNIEEKLKKGSTPERIEALSKYAMKAKASLTEEGFRNAVNDIQSLKELKISTPRGFFDWFSTESETTRVAEKFKERVNNYKG